jgi:cytochrome P450 family 142 subfamily A polypeptide 1
MTTLTDRPNVDLLDPTFHVGDPHPAYRWMRQHEPIYRDEINGLWCITRMDHLRHVERHATTFSSNRGYRSIWVPTETSMISKDDPAHTKQRKLISDRFTPRAAGRLEDDVRQLVQEAIALFVLPGRTEFVDAFAARIPSLTTCRLLGFEDALWRDVRSWSERVMRIDTMARNPQHGADGFRAVLEIAAATDRALAERRECPRDDILSVWAHAELDGCPMSDMDINSELGLVIPGGAETTRTILARALILFCERPDLWEQLASDPALIPTAVEELLRFITPLNNMFRTVTEDTEVDGVAMKEGDRVALVYPSANRDERVFTDPDELDFARDPNPHIAFGFGTHFCLGANVARLSVRVALEELTQALTNLRLAADPVYEVNVFVKGVQHLEIAFDRR